MTIVQSSITLRFHVLHFGTFILRSRRIHILHFVWRTCIPIVISIGTYRRSSVALPAPAGSAATGKSHETSGIIPGSRLRSAGRSFRVGCRELCEKQKRQHLIGLENLHPSWMILLFFGAAVALRVRPSFSMRHKIVRTARCICWAGSTSCVAGSMLLSSDVKLEFSFYGFLSSFVVGMARCEEHARRRKRRTCSRCAFLVVVCKSKGGAEVG